MDRQIDVLIADDQVETRKGLSAVLRCVAFIGMIWEANHGEAALKIVREMKPDVVYMHIRMPVMGGINTTYLIKQTWPKGKGVPLSMCPTYKQEANASGADCFLRKRGYTTAIQDVILTLFTGENIDSKS